MDFTPEQMEKRAEQLMLRAEECRDASDEWMDRAEALRGLYLASHERVVGCSADLPEGDKRVLREVRHTNVDCPCHQIRVRQLAVRKMNLERELSEKATAEKRYREERHKQQLMEQRKENSSRKEQGTMAARRTPAAVRFDPLQAKDVKKTVKILGEKAQPKAMSSSIFDTILADQEKTHGQR